GLRQWVSDEWGDGSITIQGGRMRIPTRFAILTIALVLVACTPTSWRNDHPSANWNSDFSQCAQANLVVHSRVLGTGMGPDDFSRDQCLRARGWYQTTEPPRRGSSDSNPPPEGPCPYGQYWSSARERCVNIGS